MSKKINWSGFKSEIKGIRYEGSKDFVSSRSKDYFWYSPILHEELEVKVCDLVVIPENENEIQRINFDFILFNSILWSHT